MVGALHGAADDSVLCLRALNIRALQHALLGRALQHALHGGWPYGFLAR
ncbi:unnamed protein product [Meloidogyne enterolobii]|uniref:Uncharacterized protein n=1 Tax=Meloidogyne enterolobii TaxID=390850 RepID=A0ACB1AGL7_MELEN